MKYGLENAKILPNGNICRVVPLKKGNIPERERILGFDSKWVF